MSFNGSRITAIGMAPPRGNGRGKSRGGHSVGAPLFPPGWSGCHTARMQQPGPGRPDSMLAPPPVEFAVRHGLHIAYQSAGRAPPEIVFVGGSVAMSVQWEQSATAKNLRRLASFARLITYDQQG